ELGRTQAALGLLVEARVTLLDVARSPARSGEPEAFKKARREAQKLAESIAPRLATVNVALSGVPSGSTPKVSVDGAEIGAHVIAAPLKVNPGKHEMVITVGDEEKRATFDVEEGGKGDVRLAFSGAPLPPKQTTPPPPPPPAPAPQTSTSPLVWI